MCVVVALLTALKRYHRRRSPTNLTTILRRAVGFEKHAKRILAEKLCSRFTRVTHMPVNAAVRVVVRSPGKAAPLGVLCLRVGAFTFFDNFEKSVRL